MAQPRPAASDTKRRRRLSGSGVFSLAAAAAGPTASIVGTAPLGLAVAGAALPSSYLLGALILLCFAVGYAAISRRLVNTGAFYTYVARGIGRPPAIGAAFLAVLAYFVNTVGVVTAFGYFTAATVEDSSGGAPQVGNSWIWGTIIAVVATGVVGYRQVALSARLLGFFLVGGLVAFAIFDIVVVAQKGLAAFPVDSFRPSVVLHSSPGLALMFALTGFVGIESAALYSEEVRQPERSVPRGIFAAVTTLGVFYVVSAWILVGAIGAGQTQSAALAQLGDLVTNLTLTYGGGKDSTGGQLLMAAVGLMSLAGILTGVLAFHNATARYLYVLGRDRVLPDPLGRRHPRFRSPAMASLVVTAATVIMVGIALVTGLNPYAEVAQGGVGLATLGVVSLQLIASIGIIVFFRRQGYRSYWRTLILPGLGAIGLAVGTVTLLLNFGDLVGSHQPWVTALPYFAVVAVIAGIIVGLTIRARRPARYARLAESRLRPQERQLGHPARWTRRYCLIGAGPAGLAMARRLVEEGVPFDWYERSNDVGGLWHLDRPGSPLYDGMTSVSSTATSSFPDFPMPAQLPAYPAWWQVRDYVRAYAHNFGLYDRVTFDTAVTWAKPDGAGWSVTLTTGEFRYYAGVIAATGSAGTPVLPTWPGQERYRGQIWHSARYFSASDLVGRRVLVIGAGNSGADIAVDAARAAQGAFLSIRRGYRLVPRFVAGLPTDAILAGIIEPPASLSLPPDPIELVEMLAGKARTVGLPPADHRVLAAHPTVNDGLLETIGRGWLSVRGDVIEILPYGVRFADGSTEEVDLIIAATGYDPRPSYLAPELYSGLAGEPDLYLNLFSRTHDGLTILGLAEGAGAAFPRFDDMARMAIVDITLRELGGADWQSWHAAKRTDQPDLRGGRIFATSPRNHLLIDDHAYRVLLGDLCERYGYAPPIPDWTPLKTLDRSSV